MGRAYLIRLKYGERERILYAYGTRQDAKMQANAAGRRIFGRGFGHTITRVQTVKRTSKPGGLKHG